MVYHQRIFSTTYSLCFYFRILSHLILHWVTETNTTKQLYNSLTIKIKLITTFDNGSLGSRNDEERSEMRYVMWIAFRESSNLWTHIALLWSMPVWESFNFFFMCVALCDMHRKTWVILSHLNYEVETNDFKLNGSLCGSKQVKIILVNYLFTYSHWL